MVTHSIFIMPRARTIMMKTSNPALRALSLEAEKGTMCKGKTLMQQDTRSHTKHIREGLMEQTA